jgi:predicted short-subunit dehydrogenase-like oxidoreductase (DUF2520 family)
MDIGFIGAGTVGTALALRLSERGHCVVAIASRTPASAERLAARLGGGCRVATKDEVAASAEMVFITTPDDAIQSVASEVAWHAGQSVVHCSGVASTDILEAAHRAGAQVGGFHPLQSFANVEAALRNIPGSTFGLEAEEPLLSRLKGMAEVLGGTFVVLGPGDKVLYHAAAVMACNYFVTLVKLSTDLWQCFGVDSKTAFAALRPLVQGTVNNLAEVGLPQALTGPIARGDIGTLERHLFALNERVPEVVSTYCELGLQTIPVALAKGRIGPDSAEAMRRLLRQAQEANGR